MGSLIGGPIGSTLIRKHKLTSPLDKNSSNIEVVENLEKNNAGKSYKKIVPLEALDFIRVLSDLSLYQLDLALFFKVHQRTCFDYG